MYPQEYFNDELVNVICKNVSHDSHNFVQSNVIDESKVATKHTDLISEIADTVHNRIYASELSSFSISPDSISRRRPHLLYFNYNLRSGDSMLMKSKSVVAKTFSNL